MRRLKITRLRFDGIASVSRSACLVGLCAIPLLVSIDYGGVFAWTQLVAAVGVLAVAAAVLLLDLCEFAAGSKTNAKPFPDSLSIGVPTALYCVIGCWAFFVAFQLTPIPQRLAGTLSPGSASCYSEWLEPVRAIADKPTSATNPISIHPAKTSHYLAWLMTCIPIAVVAAGLIVRKRMVTLCLVMVSMGTAIHSLGGIFLLFQHLGWATELSGISTSFGCFVNRSNAALFLNLGVASSLGLLASRFSLLGAGVQGKAISRWPDTHDLVFDLPTVIAVLCFTINLVGVVVCGSRGGLLAMIVGITIAALLSLRSNRSVLKALAIASPIAIAVAAFVSVGVNFTSFSRLSEFNSRLAGDSTVLNKRFGHWRDAMDAVADFVPAGSGAGTYRYAYLPFQNLGENKTYEHADNLYLELLLEQGLVGMLFLGLVLVLLIGSIVRLSKSQLPCDQGLCVLATTSPCRDFRQSSDRFWFAGPGQRILSRNHIRGDERARC